MLSVILTMSSIFLGTFEVFTVRLPNIQSLGGLNDKKLRTRNGILHISALCFNNLASLLWQSKISEVLSRSVLRQVLPAFLGHARSRG